MRLYVWTDFAASLDNAGVKHASAPALATIEPLLVAVRWRPGMVERKTGVFYRRGRAFLHFHEDPAGIFADLCPGEWARYALATAAERAAFLTALDAALARPCGRIEYCTAQ